MHKRNTTGLEEFRKQREKDIFDKVDEAIRELSLNNKDINFNSVHKISGVNKATLYKKEKIRSRIEELRNKQINEKMKANSKFEKTDKSKDLIIAAKDKKIRELKLEIKFLNEKIKNMETIIYEQN